MARRRLATLRASLAAAALGLAIAIYGGYERGWSWTGFKGRATLWDWLTLAVLPLAFASIPIWLRHRGRLPPAHRAALATAVVAFAVLVVLGYTLDLRWTGFPGNKLWDWLELLVLPLVVISLPIWLEVSESVRPRHLALALAAVAGLAVCAVGGYAYDWTWTGFQGNTLFDWLRLFLVPLVLPLALVPLATAWMKQAVEDDAERD